MRLIRVTAPRGRGHDIANVAFEAGIEDITIQQIEQHKPGARPSPRDAVDMHLNTPDAKAVIEAIVKAPFYDRDEYSIDVREPRSVLKSTSTREITRPICAPFIDIDQELWQFSHVTYSFVARVLIAAMLLAYGIVQDNPLFMVGGLMFLPFTPLVLGVAFGALTRQWNLVAQSLAAFVTAVLLIAAGGVAVALFADPPILFEHFPPLAAGVFFSFAIGLASALATADDAGHRQLIGIAAASQLALIPAWLGIALVYGFPEPAGEKLLAFGLNMTGMVLGGATLYGLLTWRGHLAEGAAPTRHQYKH